MQWQLIWHRWFFSVFFLLAAACGRAPNSPTATSAEVAAVSTVTPQSSPTPSPSPTPTFTHTPSPTSTQTPSPTPTLALPVYLTTPFPHQLQALTTENISEIRQLAYFGSPIIDDFLITRDRKLGFVLTSVGIVVYDLDTSKVKGQYDTIRPLRKEELSLSNDGSRFAVVSQHGVQVWSLDSGLIFEVPIAAPASWGDEAALSPDGKLLVVRDDKITFYDLESRQVVSGTPDFQGSDFRFSPDGSYFVEWRVCSNCRSTGMIWRISDWSKVRAFSFGSYRYPYAIVRGFSPDGRLIALQDSEQVEIYQVEGWRLKRQLQVHSEDARQTNEIVFSPSGEKIAVWESLYLTRDELVRVWDITTGERLSEQRLPRSMHAFSLGDDGVLMTYQIPIEVCDGLRINLQAACTKWWWWWGFYGSRIHLEDNATQFQVWRPVVPGEPVSGEVCVVQPGITQTCTESSQPAFLNNDGQFYVVRKTEKPGVHEVRRGADGSGPILGQIRSQAQFISPQWLSADGRLLLFDGFTPLGNFSVRSGTELWDIQQETRIARWPGFIVNFNVSRDGKLLALGLSEGKHLVYDVGENRVSYSSNERYGSVPWAFTEAGDLIYVGSPIDMPDGKYAFEISIIELQTLARTPVGNVVQDENMLGAIASSPDGSLLVVGMQDGTIRVIDILTKQEVHAWQAHNGNVTQLEFSADGSLLVSFSHGSRNGGDGFLRVWGIGP